MDIKILTDDEISRVMEQAKTYGQLRGPTRWPALMSVLASYGPRVTEALRLRRDQIDFARQTITFPTLKRRKPMTRTLPLLPAVADALRQYLLTANGSPYVFPSSRYGRQVVYQAFQIMLRRAGIPPIKLHALRHSAATRLAMVDLAMARDVLGHANIATTDEYVHAVRLREKFLMASGVMYPLVTIDSPNDRENGPRE